MKLFKKEEIIWVILTFILLFAISFPNFAISLRRARDATRKNDLGGMSAGLEEYFADFGTFPMSSGDGRIISCLKPGATPIVDKKGKLTADLVPCEGGKDGLSDLTPGKSKTYIKVIPVDPNNSKGVRYMYFSNGNRYQVFTSLESSDEPEFDSAVLARNIQCGTTKCNMGKAYTDGPVNISIEEWERQIDEARKKINAKI